MLNIIALKKYKKNHEELEDISLSFKKCQDFNICLNEYSSIWIPLEFLIFYFYFTKALHII